MTPHPSQSVQDVVEAVARHLDDILRYFKPGAKILVLVRSTDAPDGSRDFVLTNDTLDAAIAALKQRQTQPTLTGDI